jgi:type IV pilus assembly protein PilN
MRIAINLASQPFRRDRAMLAASIAVSLALVVTLAGLIYLILTERAQMADVRQDIGRLNRQMRAAQAEQNKLTAVLKEPANAEVLETSVFLNSLLYRKGVSWTRLLSDLEKTLPYNVKLVAVRPTLDSHNRVVLDMTLASESPEAAVTALVALEKAAEFSEVSPPVSIQPPSQSDPLHRYRITVNYAQKL